MVKIDIPMPNSCIECPFAYVEYPTDIPGCNIMECLPNCPDFGTRTPIGQKDKNCPLSTTPPTQPDAVTASLEELINDYGEDGFFIVDGVNYQANELLNELKTNSSVGEEFRKQITKTIVQYFMKFGDGKCPLAEAPEPCEDDKGCSNCMYSGRPTYKSPCSECRDNSQWEMGPNYCPNCGCAMED